MTSRNRSQALAAAALALLSLTACGSDSPATAAAPADPPASSPAAGAPPTSAAPSPTPRPALVQADLERGLLALADLPTGYAVDRSATEDEAGEQAASSPLPGCAPLVALLNESETPGAVATASVSLDGGAEFASFDETLDAFASAEQAAAAITREAAAVRGCETVTLALPGVGEVEFAVAEISFPELGDTRSAARLTATEGDLAGFELFAASVAVGEVAVHTLAYDAFVEDVESTTEQAVDKVSKELVGGGSTA